MPKIVPFIDKTLFRQVQLLNLRGGHYKKAADKVKSVVYDMTQGGIDVLTALKSIPLTNHGESRINHCIKYDLPGFCRLITIQNESSVAILFAGDHEESEIWLNKNRGLKLGIKDLDKGLITTYVSQDISNKDERIDADSDYSEGKLFEKLKSYWSNISAHLSFSVRKAFESFDTLTEEDDIFFAANDISDSKLQDTIFDVFLMLRKGNVDEAKNRLLLHEEKVTLLQEVSSKETRRIVSNDQYVNLLEGKYLKGILNSSNFYDWMVFLHPTQQEYVDMDFSGPARLLGVSGSGKTCLLVHRAVRLAKKYPKEKILILTLNQSLSKLINKLVNLFIENENLEEIQERIIISSFWEVCRNILMDIDANPLRNRIFNIKADKHGETIDEIWEEYYQCKENNDDASILFSIHQSLLGRGVYPQNYIKQEFDWIRSAFPFESRSEYLSVDREGRSIPILEVDRQILLTALMNWDKKMEDIGVIDYLGLANALYRHIEKIRPEYRCILVDEVQDFGTIELKIIRKLVKENENDLFLTGDIAQQVYSKHHKITHAGIYIQPKAHVKILKNYRNSREILEAAYEMFSKNVDEKILQSDDFEVLKPEYANFSSPKPFLRKALKLEDEISCSIKYLSEILDPQKMEKGCIAICGWSIFKVSELANSLDIQVLDGEKDLSDASVFFSDLEQTKGFEFDYMIIINANQEIIPNPYLPNEEWYRDISKLYVAMTRAKKELIISYSKVLSQLFENCISRFRQDTWENHIHFEEMSSINLSKINESSQIKEKVKFNMLGKEYLYEINSTGISRELQQKLIELVVGKNITDGQNRRIGWENMDQLRTDVTSKRNLPHLTRTFGPIVIKELQERFTKLSLKI